MAYKQRSLSHRRRTGAASSPVYSFPPPAPTPPPLPPATPLSLNPNKKTPYSIQRDYRVLEREKRVTTILSNERFRAELESILQGQRDGSAQPKKTNLQKMQEDASSQSPSRAAKATGVIGGIAVIPINDLRGVSGSKYTVAERQARCKLAAVYRLVEMFGWSQLIYNSITACSPGEGQAILVNPFGLLYSEVTASSLVAADLDGHIIDPGSTQLGINRPGFGLHSAIHAARSDVKCVVHVHTNAGVAVSSMDCGLLLASEEALSLGGISYHDGLHLSVREQSQQIAEDLGPLNKVLILRNHGVVAMGRSIEEAFHITHKLVKACEIQIAMMPVGLNNILQRSKGVWSKSGPCFGGVDVESTFTILDSIPRKWGPGELEFEALMRMLDNKGYNTGYRYKGLSLLEPGTGKSGTWNRTQSVDDTDNGWNFLDQKKIDRTEPVIRNKNRTDPVRQRKTGAAAEHEQTPPSMPLDRKQEYSLSSIMSPLAWAELTASQVAQSTGEAVERLSKGPSLLTQSPLTQTTSPRTPSTDTLRSSHFSPLEKTRHTAERVARSTGQAVRKLNQDLAARNLKNTSFPDYIQNGYLETNSEPSLLAGGGYRQQPHYSTRHDRSNGQSSSLRHLDRPEELESKTSVLNHEAHMGLSSYHQSLENLGSLSPLEKATHTAERVAGSTGVAVVKLSGSFITTP